MSPFNEKMLFVSGAELRREVPAEVYYGVQALRAKQNFPITGTKLHPVFIKNLAQVKKAAAITNNNAELLPKEKADAIIKACDEVIAGKLAEDLFDATENLDGFVAVSGVIKTCAVDLSKICNDLRLMSSGPKTGFGEINLPAKQNGSSIMPGKVNPVIPEVVSQVAFHIVGHDTTITMAAEAGQLELNAFEPVVFCNLFESITTLEKAVDTLIVNCITGITANRKHCKDLMESSAGIATALCPHIGYKASATIAKTAVKTGKSVRELVLEQGIMTEKELEEVLDPYLMTEVGEERKEDEVRRKAC